MQQLLYMHTHIYTYTYSYVYIYICVLYHNVVFTIELIFRFVHKTEMIAIETSNNKHKKKNEQALI